MKKNKIDSNNKGYQVNSIDRFSNRQTRNDNGIEIKPNEISLTSVETGDKKPNK